MTAYATGPESGVVYSLTSAEGYEAVFNDSAHANYVGVLSGEDAITGLDSPEILENAGPLVEADGGLHGTFWAGRRPITLQGELFSASKTTRNQMMTRLQRASMALRSDATLKWTPTGSIGQQIKVRRNQPLRITGGFKKKFFVPLVAADPRIYSQSEYTSSNIVAGTPVTIENQGDAESFPRMRITGPGTNPVVSTGGRSLTINTTLTGGQYIDVDLLRKTVVRSDGANLYSSVAYLTSTWWGLLPSTQSVSVAWTSGNTGASIVVVYWRDAWL
jgi:hypothetical protein